MNFAGGGIHEVAALLQDGTFVAGHFDNSSSADVAIAALGDNYRAVWSSLNPISILPNGRTLNPTRLTRGPRVGAAHIAARVSLLFDFDPPRPTGVMSTDEEHEAASVQARQCQSWLRSLGWPLLTLCDSGSGAHLRPIVEMDTSAENTRLAQRTLTALRQKFSFLDVGMWDLPRLCRYYGTWNRKGPAQWRQSAVLENGDAKPVSVSQFEALCELMTVPKIQAVSDGVARPEAQEKFVRRFTAYCERIGVGVDAVRQLGDGTVFVQTGFCLLNEDHTGSSCGVGVGRDGVRKNLCKHSGCAMPWARWSRLVEEKYGELMRLDGEIRWTK